jgi:multiple sugar transport system ATP-binding protein
VWLQIGPQRLPLPRSVLAERPSLASAVGKEVIAGLRAEDIHPEPREGSHELAASVILSEALGSSVHLTFGLEGTPVDENRLGSGLAKDEEDHGITRLGGGTQIQGVAVFPPRLKFRTGDPITVHVDTSRLYFFDVDSGDALR